MKFSQIQPATKTSGELEVFRALLDSHIYRDYAQDFSRSTLLPVALTPVETWHLAHHGSACESPFCALLAQHSPACAACLRTQQRLAAPGGPPAQTVECAHGLCETAVAVRAGNLTFGFIRTGQVFRHPPTPEAFHRVQERLARWRVTIDSEKLRAAYFGTRVMEPRAYRSAVGLLQLLAQHLSMLSNQILLQQMNVESPVIASGKQFIEEHLGERLTLRRLADALHISHFYLCKLFRRVTGTKFTHFVVRLRVEKAKNLLLNPNYRASEIAYDVGFASVTHFNRMFKRFAGLSPTAYRGQIAKSGAGVKSQHQIGGGWLPQSQNEARTGID